MKIRDYLLLFITFFRLFFPAKCSKHCSMDVEFLKLGMVIEEVNKINLRERLKGLIACEFYHHKEMLHVSSLLQDTG